ncbi:unnamed protein product [Penicillium egyptiacum]|uniref:Uncharacterized protein n=1 Tax=Penicillium egyptiacum TaxID=1303716 RepID=A0A9W4KQT4_9EURO|nr:unnamed protein product [Penicillium egyptiacum]
MNVTFCFFWGAISEQYKSIPRNYLTHIMAGIVNGPLSLFRKSDSSKPLHARWGDVSISVPTDGSWNQYDNPHRPVKERSAYGPGYVPDCSPQDRTPRPVKEEDPEDDVRSVCSAASTSSRRSSLSLGALRPGRLSVRLASRPKQLRGETQIERESHSEQKRNEFAYRPIRQDYTSEVIEKTIQPNNRFKYIPTNGRYLQSSGTETPRSQSVNSPRSPRPRHGSLSESSDRRYSGRDRDHYTPAARGSAYYEEDRRSLHSTSFRDSSDSSGSRWNYGLPPRRRTSSFVPADSKRASSISKSMTLAMVPDPDDLYE